MITGQGITNAMIYAVLNILCKSCEIKYHEFKLCSIESYFYSFCKDGQMMVS